MAQSRHLPRPEEQAGEQSGGIDSKTAQLRNSLAPIRRTPESSRPREPAPGPAAPRRRRAAPAPPASRDNALHPTTRAPEDRRSLKPLTLLATPRDSPFQTGESSRTLGQAPP